jgi:hypothetical protein
MKTRIYKIIATFPLKGEVELRCLDTGKTYYWRPGHDVRDYIPGRHQQLSLKVFNPTLR